jgi:trehalose/maltose hydrolase-like predicted phosphorylase
MVQTGHSQDKEWIIKTDQIEPSKYFGVTVANGMLGLVSSSDPFSVGEVVLNGAFDTYGRGRVSNIMKVFNPANIRFLNPEFTEEGKNRYKQMFDKDNLLSQEQAIDIRYGVFSQTMDYRDIKIIYKLRALRHLPYTMMVEVEVEAKKDLYLAPASILKAPEILRDVNNYYTTIDVPGHVRVPMMTSTASSPTGKLQVAASTSILFEHGKDKSLLHEERNYGDHNLKFYVSLKRGERLSFTVFSSICTSAHFADPRNEAERLTLYAYLEGAERNIERHNNAWKELWKGDILIEGDRQVQQDVRFALYHLYSFARAGTSYSMSPMGLSGLGYNGHVFWDTELWMYPPLLMLQPEIAKSLLEYRFKRLEAAKTNAFSHGYQGAMFPWESDDAGQEATPIWALTGPFEHHITGDVGWAFWKYFQVTKDREWLKDRGYPVLKEVADFWVSRVDKKEDGTMTIRNVVGADEYAEGVDDNAFTNGIAKVSLKYAVQAAEILGIDPNPDWGKTAENIPILSFDNGVTREHATYEGEIIKQADVNLLSYPLDLIRESEDIKRDIDYYESRYDVGGPAMGFCILSILNNWTGNREKAWKYFTQSYRPNQVPPTS